MKIQTPEQIAEIIATSKLSEQMPESWGDLIDVIAAAITADRAQVLILKENKNV